MLLSLKWLQKYIPDFQINNVDSFRHKVDTRLSEVDSVSRRGEGLNLLVTAQITEVAKHPKSEKLSVCQVDFGNGENGGIREIVCGAPNVRPGLVTVACLPGGSVYAPQTEAEEGEHQLIEISVREVAGVKSNGMMCSTAELGMNTNHDQIIELPEGTVIGEDVTHVFRDTVISIENKAFPHRPDVFSHLGMAREFSAIFKNTFTDIDYGVEAIAHAEEELPVSVKIEVPDTACPRFSATSVSEVKVQSSPLWLQVMLSYCGIRPISNVVDITNYVMLDIGQPLHAFDYTKISGGELRVRYANKGEKLTTIDGKERELDETIMVVADRENAQSVAGIMGGMADEIGPETTQVLLEAANWEMFSVRRSSRKLGLRSEASTRFEKGLSAHTTRAGLVRAANMMLDLCGGSVAYDIIDVGAEVTAPAEPKVVYFELNSVSHRLGIQLQKQELIEILESLGLEVLNAEQISSDAMNRNDLHTEIAVQIPLHRRDLNIPVDILEEIARFHGYENITPTLPKRDLAPAAVNVQFERRQSLKRLMNSSGLNEILTYSMVGTELFANALLDTKGLLKVQNPISPELAFVRNTLVPSILEKVKANQTKFQSFGLFEISRIATTEIVNELPDQPHRITGAFLAADGITAYRKLKLALDNLNRFYKGAISVERVSNQATTKTSPYLHPGQSGVVKLAEEVIGVVGVVHPQVISNFDLGSSGVAIFELDCDALTNFEIASIKFTPLSKFPAVVRDVSFWQESGEIGKLTSAIAELVENVEVLDLFTKEGKTSVTVRITLQPQDRTLTQEEILQVISDISAAAEKVGFAVRD